MSNKTKILRCPYCQYRFEAVGVDNLHPHCDVKKPKETEVEDGSIDEQLYDCKNPNCKRPFTVYWYEPKPAGPSVSEAFFFRILPSAPSHCGLISLDVKGYLYLPFFYVNPEYEYGTWLPVNVELRIAFPVFVTD